MDGTTYKPTTNIYKYSANINLVANEETYTIANNNIKSIIVDFDYKNKNMPMIFITAAVDRNLIDIMVNNQDTGIMILNIQRAISNSDMPNLYTDYIFDKFVYFMTDDINKNKDLDYVDDNAGREDLYKIITFGLLNLDCINKNKKVVNGVFKGKLSSIMYYLTSHLPVLIEPPTDNILMDHIFIPPMNSVSKSLTYLNSLNVFYNTPYRFFIDFDCAYLISSSGKPIKKKGENIGTVFITVNNNLNEASKLQGMTTDETQSMYLIECDALDCKVSDKHISEKLYSKLSATSAFGTKTDASLQEVSQNSSITEKTRAIRVANDNTGLINNVITSIDQGAIQFLVQKNDIDSSVLSMNKEYIIKADETYGSDIYNGSYLLSRKRELYIREDESFIMSVTMMLEKVPGNTGSMPTAAAKTTTGLN